MFTSLLAAAAAVAFAGPPPATMYDQGSGGANGRDTLLRSYSGTTVFTAYDRRTRSFRLTLLRDGVTVQPRLPATSDRAFDADIGPGPDGRPVLVYSRCSGDCDLFMAAVDGGPERPIDAVNTPADEQLPSVWGGRLAFTRGRKDRGGVFVADLRGAPGGERQIDAALAPGPPLGVLETELRGNRLAVLSIAGEDDVGQATIGLRLSDLRTGRTRTVRAMNPGIGGQSFFGVSLTRRHVGWYEGCAYPEGCRTRRGAWRSDTRSGVDEYARGSAYALAFGLRDDGSALRVMREGRRTRLETLRQLDFVPR
jgi:hypothetical protein